MKIKVRINVTVEVDVDEWASEYGTERRADTVRADVKSYVANTFHSGDAGFELMKVVDDNLIRPRS